MSELNFNGWPRAHQEATETEEGEREGQDRGTIDRGEQEGKSWGIRGYHWGGGFGCDITKLKVTKGSDGHSHSRKLL